MLRLYIRKALTKEERSLYCIFRYISDNSGDDKNAAKDGNRKQENKENPTLKKLNSLLQKMIDEDVAVKSNKSLEFARPIPKKGRKPKIPEEIKNKLPLENKMASAAKKVAQVIGENEKQIESELLQKLLDTVPDQKKGASKSLSDIIKGMKIDCEQKPLDASRAHQVKLALGKFKSHDNKLDSERTSRRKAVQKPFESLQLEKVDLFGNEPLGIFTSESANEGITNKIWNKLYNRELHLAVTHPPTNYFQEMILWTEQGKIWKFPIDNEQDMDESNVPFSEHIFLEKHLESWCPKKGPISHFMELVCVGLSKNPYLSVQEKKEHIMWFRDYFADKQKLLRDVGAIPPTFEISKSDQKNIEA